MRIELVIVVAIIVATWAAINIVIGVSMWASGQLVSNDKKVLAYLMFYWLATIAGVTFMAYASVKLIAPEWLGSHMSEDRKSDVKINYAPEIPKDKLTTFVQLVEWSEAVAYWGRKYLESGDPNDARRMLNARMALKSMGCKSQLPAIDGAIASGGHPMKATEAAIARDMLKGSDGKVGIRRCRCEGAVRAHDAVCES